MIYNKGFILHNHIDHPHVFNIDGMDLKFASHILRTLIQKLIQNSESHIFPLNSMKLILEIEGFFWD